MAFDNLSFAEVVELAEKSLHKCYEEYRKAYEIFIMWQNSCEEEKRFFYLPEPFRVDKFEITKDGNHLDLDFHDRWGDGDNREYPLNLFVDPSVEKFEAYNEEYRLESEAIDATRAESERQRKMNQLNQLKHELGME